jgi:hypothetical protein
MYRQKTSLIDNQWFNIISKLINSLLWINTVLFRQNCECKKTYLTSVFLMMRAIRDAILLEFK